MGFEKGEGHYFPYTEKDKKIFLANQIAYQARKAIFDELGYHASAGISTNKTVAKVSSSSNKPNGQTVVPERYIQRALADVPIKSIRFLGGKLGKQLRENGLEKMGDIQTLDVENDLAPLIGIENAQWVKGLSLGICDEMVTEKKIPKSAGAIKTFRQINSFEKIQKQIHLVTLDIITKVKEHLKEHDIFPTSLHIC